MVINRHHLGGDMKLRIWALSIAVLVTSACDSSVDAGSSCNAKTCDGCCTPEGTCRAVTTNTECGAAGSVCIDCSSQNGVCASGVCLPAVVDGGAGDSGVVDGGAGDGGDGGVGDGGAGDGGGGDGGAVDGGCTAEGDVAFCTRLAKDCDNVTAADNCGAPRTVNCGSCNTPKTCGGAGLPGVCSQAMGTVSWSRFADPMFWRIRFYGPKVAVDGLGNVAVAGGAWKSMDLGTGTISNRGSADAFLARYASNNIPLWSGGYGNSSVLGHEQAITDVSSDADGNVYVIGTFEVDIALPGKTLTANCTSCNPAEDCFVAKFAPNGALLWATQFGNNGLYATGIGLGVTSTREVVAACNGSFGTRVVKLQSDGGTAWTKPFPVSGQAEIRDLTVGPSDEIALSGDFQGTPDFGGGSVSPAAGRDAFLARYDSSLNFGWARSFGSVGDDSARGVAFGSDGSLAVVGDVEGTVDFGSGLTTGYGGRDLAVVKFASAGGHVWDRRYGGSGSDYGHAVTVDGAGNVIAAGSFEGSASFGGAQLTSAGWLDAVVLKLSSGGTHLWSQRFGGPDGNDRALAVTKSVAGNILVVGDLQGTVNFGSGPYTSGELGDQSAMFLLQLAP